MKTTSLVMALGIAAGVFATPAMAAGNLVQFEGGIGVIPVSTGQGTATTSTTVNRNFVRGVSPPGQIWVIKDLRAEVKDDGRIRVHGKGLLLGGGNNIGGNANASVYATLFCEVPPAPTAPQTFIERSTAPAGVPLDPDGDFKIDDTLDNPTSECPSPVLLIRNAANKAWFAAGIPRR